MGSRIIFIPEINDFAIEKDYTLTIDNGLASDYDDFLNCQDLETLNRLLATQLLHENYEMAELVTKYITIKIT